MGFAPFVNNFFTLTASGLCQRLKGFGKLDSVVEES